jgi:hypothetical protein
MNSFDIDGVIYMGPGNTGVFPGPNDVIITGRSVEESQETLDMLRARGIHNQVFFNPLPYDEKTRSTSGLHKAKTIAMLGNISIHFEDDPIQAKTIRDLCPDVHVVMLEHDLVNKENQRHEDWQ